MLTATIIGLGLLLAVALIAPVISSEHARRRTSQEGSSPGEAVESSGSKDPDTPAPPLPAPPLQ